MDETFMKARAYLAQNYSDPELSLTEDVYKRQGYRLLSMSYFIGEDSPALYILAK